MKSLWFYYLQSFKDIVSHGTIFTTLILSVLFYSFFYPTAYQAQQAEALPIIIDDEEQSSLSTRIIGQVAQSPNVEIQAITGNFAEAKQWMESQKADGILLLPDNLSQSLRHGETGGIGLYLSTANFLVTKQIGLGLATSVEQTLADYTETALARSRIFHLPFLCIKFLYLIRCPAMAAMSFLRLHLLIIHQTILLGLSMLILVYLGKKSRIKRKCIDWDVFSGLYYWLSGMFLFIRL